MDPSLNPLPDLFVLQTYATLGTEVGYRSYLYFDEGKAKADGQRLRDAKPSEVSSFTFVVVPLEGPVP